MKFTLSWLKQFLDTNASLNEITDKLTAIGLEVESVIDHSSSLGNFKVAYIKNTVPHPNADTLKICTVDIGEGELQIVCGASNARSGIKVVLASVGSIIPNGNFKIKESEIRGLKSAGMLCSASELLIGSDDNGIIELADEAVIGDSFIKYYKGLNDPVIEINVTPNRGDALGVYGIARDLASTGIGVLKSLDIKNIANSFDTTFNVKVLDNQACPLFVACELRNLESSTSPEWLKQLLEKIDIKSISPIVDVTNYISFTFGQPMHAYDADKISELTVDTAKANCTFTALNNENYNIAEGDIVIFDNQSIACLAGIIGSASSSCDASTSRIILEAAYFTPHNIAITGRRLRINTDSRYRFERHVDKTFTKLALNIATNMILSICGGEASDAIIINEKENFIPSKLQFDINLLYKHSGVVLEQKLICDILHKLGFKYQIIDTTILELTVPSWRNDITIAEDVIEEILRIHGYDNIPSIPVISPSIQNILGQKYKNINLIKRLIASLGYNEIVSWSFVNSKKASLFKTINSDLFVLNPISSELDYMRPTLAINLLETVTKNQARTIKDINLFEMGPIFLGNELEDEKLSIAIVKNGCYLPRNCHIKTRAVNIYDIKSDLEYILQYLSISLDKCQIEDVAPSYYHPARCATIKLGKTIIGYFGEIHPSILKNFGVESSTVACEICYDNLLQFNKKTTRKQAVNFSNFQINHRDYAFLVDNNIPIVDIISAVKNIDKNLIKSVNLFDIYTNDTISSRQKSIAFNVEIQANDKTLTERELSTLDQQIIDLLDKNFQGKIRS